MIQRALSLEAAPVSPSTAGATAHRAGYRADIDGLRALAVAAVIGCHLGFRGFQGGFVGVDVFFVISGYLVTGVLLRDQAQSPAGVLAFYRRRILRIFPALFVMLALVTPLAAILLLPGELVGYGRSLGAAAISISNFVFSSEAGYFDFASRLEPLLHTWSLGVEEQFYLLWPLLLWACGRGRPWRIRLVVAAVTAMSLILACWLVATGSRSLAFYMLPSRAWELGLGGLLAILPLPKTPRWVKEGAALVGLAAIGFAVVRYNDFTTPFPGLAAILPCAGAALVIWAGQTETSLSRLLSIGPAVFIGQISYSLYLWHWPLIVLARLLLILPASPIGQQGVPQRLALVAVTLILGALSWALVERPFRRGSWSAGRVFAGAAAAATVTGIVALMFVVSRGFDGRFTPAQVAVAAYADRDEAPFYRQGSCFLMHDTEELDLARCMTPSAPRRPVVLLVGDSFAAHLWPGLSRLRQRLDVLEATKAACRPLLAGGATASCRRFRQEYLGRWLAVHHPDLVMIAGRWTAADAEPLRATLASLRRGGQRVVVIGPPPVYNAALPRLLAMAGLQGPPSRALIMSNFAVDTALARITAEAGYPYLSQISRLCRGAVCRVWASPGAPLQFDHGHLTHEGSAVVVDLLAPELEALAARRDWAATRTSAEPGRGFGF